jgi:hypothetical protein
MRVVRSVVAAIALLSLFASTAHAAGHCANGRSKDSAMWLSIAHPGLGEYYLKHWGPWEHCPQKKFWLGFIPFYGWPGYLQVKSAVDASHCRTNDDLTFKK